MEYTKKRVYRKYPPLQRLNTVQTYAKYGWRITSDLEYVPRSTIYRWVKLKKSGRKNWEIPLSKRPKKLYNLQRTPDVVAQIIAMKTENPRLRYRQIKEKLSQNLSISSICRVWRTFQKTNRH